MCLGTGLCLHLASNNAFSIQSCTDPSWPELCAGHFKQLLGPKKGGYKYVLACGRSFRTPCCLGADASCCSDNSKFNYLPRIKNPHMQSTPKITAPSIDKKGSPVQEQTDASGEGANDEQLLLGRPNVAAAIVLLLGIIVAICTWLCVGMRNRQKMTPGRLDEGSATTRIYWDTRIQAVTNLSSRAGLNQRLGLSISLYENSIGSVDAQRARRMMEENPWGG
jgi:hypothetical protein